MMWNELTLRAVRQSEPGVARDVLAADGGAHRIRRWHVLLICRREMVADLQRRTAKIADIHLAGALGDPAVAQDRNAVHAVQRGGRAWLGCGSCSRTNFAAPSCWRRRFSRMPSAGSCGCSRRKRPWAWRASRSDERVRRRLRLQCARSRAILLRRPHLKLPSRKCPRLAVSLDLSEINSPRIHRLHAYWQSQQRIKRGGCCHGAATSRPTRSRICCRTS